MITALLISASNFAILPLLLKLHHRFFSEKSILGTLVLEALLLIFVLVPSLFFKKRWPDATEPSLVIFPTCRLRSVVLGLYGLLLGSFVAGVILAVVYGLGGIQITWKGVEWLPSIGILLTFLFVNFLGAVWEEYTARGWPFAVCVRSLGPHGTVIILAAFFALAHMVHPIWSVRSIIFVWLAGIFLGYLMLWSRNILIPIGFHTGFNFVQYESTTPRLWQVERSSNVWLSGGTWGIEASAAGYIVFMLGILIVSIGYWRAHRRNDRTGH